MSLALLFGLIWKSAACAAAALAALHLLRGRSAAEQSQAAHVGLLATVLTPFASLALPPLVLPAETLAPLTSVTEQAARVIAAPAPTATAAAASAAVPVEATANVDWGAVAGWAYALPAALLALVLLVGVFRLQRLRARANVIEDPAWLTALARAQRRAGFKHGAALLLSSDVTSPVSWGLLRPVVIVDQETYRRAAEAEAIITHELAHLARLDWAKLLLGAAATALFWFNPLVWALARRCHDLREEAADDAVLERGVGPADYAELLVRCARSEGRALLAANGVSPARGSIARRVGRVLAPSTARGGPKTGWLLGCGVAAAAFAAPLAVTLAPAPQVVVNRAEAGTPAVAAAAAPDSDDSVGAAGAPVQRVAGGAQTIAPVQRGVPSVQGQNSALGEALLVASRRVDLAAMDALLAAGANPDATVRGDGSPLIVAARAGRTDVVRRLLARGADVNLAVWGDGNPLIAAAAAGRLDMVRLLLDSGADVNARIDSDENALIQASWKGHADIVRLLIDRGADVNARVGVRTALGMARGAGHAEVERLLLQAGARA